MGNPHLMESERVLSAESKFAEGYLGVRELVRAIALSPEYSRRFFEPNAPYRFVELNFKHLLGRAPSSQQELSHHIQIWLPMAMRLKLAATLILLSIKIPLAKMSFLI